MASVLRVRQGTSPAGDIRHRDRVEQIWRTILALQCRPESMSLNGSNAGGSSGKHTAYRPSA